VLLMAEETVAHMRERLVVPPLEEIRIIDRKKPQDLGIPPESYLPWGHDIVAPMATWGEGYNVNLVGLVHLEDGNVTQYGLEMHDRCIKRLHAKIEGNVDEIARIETKFTDACKHLMICYGSVSRTAIEAVSEARKKYGIDIGYLRLKTLWPFPEQKLRDAVHSVDTIFVPEMNLGMMKHPITEALRDRCNKIVSIPNLASLHTPEYILSRIHEEIT
jgi:2-oxoglutarate ferredoxin oxidoreductase subunit alpha